MHNKKVDLATNMLCNAGVSMLCNLSWWQWGLYVFVAFIFTVPMSLISDFKNFVYINSCAVGVTFVCLFIVTFDVFATYLEVGVQADYSTLTVFSFHNFVKFFGIAAFSIEGMSTVLPIKNKMREPQKFNYFVMSVTGIVCICTVIMSVFAYFVRFNKANLNRNLGQDLMTLYSLITTR